MSATNDATGALLRVLTSVNAELSLGLTIGNVVVPIIVGLVKEIRTSVAGTTVEYTIVLRSTGAILDAIIASGQADIATINKELERFGLPPLAVPPPAAPPATA